VRTAQTPEPIDIPYLPQITIRGQLWLGEAATVVLIHDAGADLDVWGRLPAYLAGSGYRVLAVDLPGHGLSDDPWEPDLAPEAVAAIVAYARSLAAGRCFAISMGGIVPIVGAITLDGHVAISPCLDPEWAREESRTPCLIFVGGADPTAAAAANSYFRGRLGYGVVSSFGTAENGAALLRSAWAGHLQEQIVAFLRDYGGGS
jgi:pimeloyl-ACP methyl ester carboxylesterase